MMRSKKFIELALLKKRMLKYKIFSIIFSYPEKEIFLFFPSLIKEKENLIYEYDSLFRNQKIWLYGTEHLGENEFQKIKMLSDIMGFYKAFGLEIEKDRPDFISIEIEFMYYLIFKQFYILKSKREKELKEKLEICLMAQYKFFNEHLYPAIRSIYQKIVLLNNSGFYTVKLKELYEFLTEELKYIKI